MIPVWIYLTGIILEHLVDWRRQTHIFNFLHHLHSQRTCHTHKWKENYINFSLLQLAEFVEFFVIDRWWYILCGVLGCRHSSRRGTDYSIRHHKDQCGKQLQPNHVQVQASLQWNLWVHATAHGGIEFCCSRRYYCEWTDAVPGSHWTRYYRSVFIIL